MFEENNVPNPAFRHKEDVVETPDEKKQENKKARPVGVLDVSSIDKYTFSSLAIGKDASRYIAIFKLITQGKFIIPSKQAGIFGMAWLIYRRCSYYGFIAYVATIMLAYELFTKIVVMPKMAQVIAIFVVTHVVFYFIGNFIYWYTVRKKIDSYRFKYGESSAMTYLSETGGTISGFNLVAAIIMLQGGMLLTVFGLVYVDGFMQELWTGFLELSRLNNLPK